MDNVSSDNTEASIVTNIGLLTRVVDSMLPHTEKPTKSQTLHGRRFEGVLFAPEYVTATTGATAGVWFPNAEIGWSHHGGQVLLDAAQLATAVSQLTKLVKSNLSQSKRRQIDYVLNQIEVTLVTNGNMFALNSGEFSCSGRTIRGAGFPTQGLESYFPRPDTDAFINNVTHWMGDVFIRVGESFNAYTQDHRPRAFALTYLQSASAARFEFSDGYGRLLVLAMPARG